MNNPNYKGIELLPLSVIEAARAGMPKPWSVFCGITAVT